MNDATARATEITVQGSFEGFYPAERATVSASVAFEGADRAAVVRRATTGSAALTAGWAALHDPAAGPVTWWASDRIRVWSHRPFNDKGEQKPLVHHASVSARAKFRDFGVLADWVERAARHEGVAIDGIEWDLTAARTTSVTAEVRSRAVRDAVDKASVFAQALGLSTVRAIAVADPGMLGDSTRASGPAAAPVAYARMAKDSAGGAEGLSFTPEDIAVSATVDVRFVAS